MVPKLLFGCFLLALSYFQARSDMGFNKEDGSDPVLKPWMETGRVMGVAIGALAGLVLVVQALFEVFHAL
jgi:hypothetical protein